MCAVALLHSLVVSFVRSTLRYPCGAVLVGVECIDSRKRALAGVVLRFLACVGVN